MLGKRKSAVTPISYSCFRRVSFSRGLHEADSELGTRGSGLSHLWVDGYPCRLEHPHPLLAGNLKRVAALMEKYRDVPMDFADATLVVLGEEAGTNWVFTLDRRGFSTYRLRGRGAFRILP